MHGLSPFSRLLLSALLPMAVAHACQSPTDVVQFLIPVQNFAEAYQKTFAMSDGSFVNPSENQHMRHAFERMLQKTRAVGASFQVTPYDEYNVTMCRQDFARVLLLSVLGNFVSKPEEMQEQMQLSYTGSIATVVVDRSGDLVVVNSFDATRSYYLETLLFLSVIAIARLSVMKPVLIGDSNSDSASGRPPTSEGAVLKFRFSRPR